MAIDSRTYILDRIKSRKVSIEEFNFDNLTAPPIAMMFTPQDIQDLYYIAHSIKLSSHPEKKLQYINDIMSKRGFVKFIGGTNRISYRPIEDNSFLVKVAIDDVGRSDNPREFTNQHALKPFVTKVFEVTPCGTLGVFERVVPITNRQEFMSVSEDVFTLINEWLIGEYVMDDIGSNYFMNYGIRKGFGVVLLDYPYMHKVDYNKLFCALEDKTFSTKSGKCEGEIDYDAGFNKLVCKKCGAIYKAIDLAKAIEDEKVIIKGGIIKMSLNINISGGSKSVDRKVEVGNSGMVAATPSKPIAPSNFSTVSKSLNIQISRDGEKSDKNDEPVMAVNGVGEVGDLTIKDEKDEEKIVEKEQSEKLEESVSNEGSETDEKSAADDSEVSAQKPGEVITTPIEFHEDGSEKLEQIKKEAAEKIKSNEEDLKDSAEDIFGYLNICDPEQVTAAITKYIEEHCYLKCTLDGISKDVNENDQEVIVFNYRSNINTNDDKYTIEIMAEDDYIPLTITFGAIKSFLEENGIDISEVAPGESYNGFYGVAGKIISEKDIDRNAEPYKKVIALIDSKGNFLTNRNNEIVVVEMIDNKNMANLCIKSTQWVRCVEDKLKDLDNLSELESNNSADTEVKEAPVGAAPAFTESN